MILVKFRLRSRFGLSDEEVEIAKGKLPHVPRVGETVSINDVARTVHSVEWDVTGMEVLVWLEQ
jgi:hypothetical protein